MVLTRSKDRLLTGFELLTSETPHLPAANNQFTEPSYRLVCFENQVTLPAGGRLCNGSTALPEYVMWGGAGVSSACKSAGKGRWHNLGPTSCTSVPACLVLRMGKCEGVLAGWVLPVLPTCRGCSRLLSADLQFLLQQAGS